LSCRIESTRLRDQTLLVFCVDIKKAFPTVRREILFKVLHEQGTPDNVIRTLINIYKDANSVIRGKNGFGCTFPIKNGTRKGGVESPILYILFVAELLDILAKVQLSDGDPMVGKFSLRAVMVAHDLALGAFSQRDAQALLCQQFYSHFWSCH